jgi:hypothetical protein
MTNFKRWWVPGFLVLGGLALFLTAPTKSQAQTPDGQTPAEESVCEGLSGAAQGLCNAYCEAMDCSSAFPSASDDACSRVRDRFVNVAGTLPPCDFVQMCSCGKNPVICPDGSSHCPRCNSDCTLCATPLCPIPLP